MRLERQSRGRSGLAVRRFGARAASRVVGRARRQKNTRQELARFRPHASNAPRFPGTTRQSDESPLVDSFSSSPAASFERQLAAHSSPKMAGMPVTVLQTNTKRDTGRKAQMGNIAAAKVGLLALGRACGAIRELCGRGGCSARARSREDRPRVARSFLASRYCERTPARGEH